MALTLPSIQDCCSPACSCGTQTSNVQTEAFANAAAARADTNLPDGKVIVVTSLGLFEYDSLSVAVDDGTTVIKPTITGSNPGAYLRIYP